MLSVFTTGLICKLLFALDGNRAKLVIKKLYFSVTNVNSFFDNYSIVPYYLDKPEAALPDVLNAAAVVIMQERYLVRAFS